MAFTIATMPARIASGRSGQGAMTSGQGQLDRPLGLQVDDGGAMGFPFLGVFPGNDRLQGSNE